MSRGPRRDHSKSRSATTRPSWTRTLAGVQSPCSTTSASPLIVIRAATSASRATIVSRTSWSVNAAARACSMSRPSWVTGKGVRVLPMDSNTPPRQAEEYSALGSLVLWNASRAQ
jgi:hypothetical protein